MRRDIFFAIALLSFSISAIAQSEVREFTYLTYSKTTSNEAYIGAGFFLKLKKDLYFITAKHLTSVSSDNLNILICDTCTGLNRTLKINISTLPKGTNFVFGDTDIYAQKIDINFLEKINSVEKFIPKNYKGFDFEEIESIVMYGYPKAEKNSPFDLITSYPEKVLTKASIIGKYNLVRFSEPLNRFDSLNYWATATNNTTANEGDSGSPVFFIIGKKYYFGGMCVSGSHKLNVISIIRPEKLIQFLQRSNKLSHLNPTPKRTLQ